MKETDPVVEDSKYGREHWFLRQFFCSFDRIITILSNQLIGNPLPCAFGRHWFYQLDPCSFYFLETIFSIEYIYILKNVIDTQFVFFIQFEVIHMYFKIFILCDHVLSYSQVNLFWQFIDFLFYYHKDTINSVHITRKTYFCIICTGNMRKCLNFLFKYMHVAARTDFC